MPHDVSGSDQSIVQVPALTLPTSTR